MIELTAVDREDERKGKCLVNVSNIVMIREYEKYCTINISDGEEIYVATSFSEIKEKLYELYPEMSSHWLELNKTCDDASVKGFLIKSKYVVSVFEYPSGTRIDIFDFQSNYSYTVVAQEPYDKIFEKFKGQIEEQKRFCQNIRDREKFRRTREKKGFRNSDVGD